MPRGIRGSRESEMSEMNAVRQEEETPWKRGQSLDMPPAKAGMEQRWIRFAVGGKEDPANISRKLKEGWKPVKADNIPEEFVAMKMEQGKWAGCMVVEGMLLCERPASIGKKRDKFFRDETERRTTAIRHDLEKINNANQNPAFGPIQMAQKSVPVREVRAQED